MNKGLYFVSFAVGAGVGALATWQYFKTKYEKLMDEEITSVKETFSRLNKDRDDALKTADAALKAAKATLDIVDDKDKDVSIIEKHYGAYNDLANEYKSEEEESEKNMIGKPYVISPEEFGELDEYETVSLTYFADGYLVDEDDEIITDVEGLVGEDSLTHFGEYEDDSVFVRNDERATDYEILKDTFNYKDVYESRN